ncbi:hypothetical protein Emed_007345 [Eimeria media]
MIGENPLTALDLDVVDAAVCPPTTKLFQKLVDPAPANIVRAQAQQTHHAEAHQQDVSFDVGDPVWLSTKFMQARGTRKRQPQFVKPFKVLKRVGKVAHLLDLPPSTQAHPVFQMPRFLKRQTSASSHAETAGMGLAAPAGENKDPVFEVVFSWFLGE